LPPVLDLNQQAAPGLSCSATRGHVVFSEPDLGFYNLIVTEILARIIRDSWTHNQVFAGGRLQDSPDINNAKTHV
jgi:hypothetical protein